MIYLRGITWSHQRGFDPLVATARAYHQLHPDVVIEWEQLGFEELYHRPRRDFSSGAGEIDLLMYDHPWTGEYAVNNWLYALDEFLTPEQRADLEEDADPASLACYVYGGKLWALPVDAACLILVYRPDLLEADDSAELADWDSVLRLARRIHRPPERYAFGDQYNSFVWLLGIAAALGDRPYSEPGRGMDREAGRRALELMRQVHDMSIPQAELRGRRVYEFMLEDDRVAMAHPFAYITYYGIEAPRKLGAADIPAMSETRQRTSFLGGMGLGISRLTRHPQIAWDYAWFVMSRQVQKGTYVENNGQPGRVSALTSGYAVDRRDGFGPILARALDGCYIRPTWPGWFWGERAGQPILGRYLDGELDADAALAEFDREIERIRREGGRSHVA